MLAIDSFIKNSQFINNVAANIFWQDKESKYLGCNTNLLTLLISSASTGIQAECDIIGKTVCNFLPQKYANNLFETDQQIIQSGIEKIVEEKGLNRIGQTAYFLSKKTPLYNAAGKIIGLIGFSFDITGYKKVIDYFRQVINLNNHVMKNVVADTKTEKYVTLPKLLHQNQADRFYLMGIYENIYLTKREAECVFHLTEGNTAKQIGKILNLSPRTVETYLAKVKEKLKCHTIVELVSKVLPFLQNYK